MTAKQTHTNGKLQANGNTITSKIPHTEYSRIIQTKSSPETTAALLNEAEGLYSEKPRHFNTKRVYPFWKVCQSCNHPFQTHTKEQAVRNKYCSQGCVSKIIGEANSGKKQKQQECGVCGNLFYPTWQSQKKPRVYCSTVCSGKSKDWIKMYAANGKGKKNPGKGLKMEKNPAWKGGLTYMKRKGKYANQSIKYVRCPMEFIQMARKDGYVMEHRLMVAKEIGRPLLRTECVHHINHDATDNRMENLMLFRSNADHKRHEHGQPIKPLWQPSQLSNIAV